MAHPKQVTNDYIDKMHSQKLLKIGVLAFYGDVAEHISATEQAAKKLKLDLKISAVRTKQDLLNLNGLIIPGGESPTLQKLCQRAGMWEGMKKIKNIFGTCAGAIMLAKKISNKTQDQETLGLMDIDLDRNAYGRQTDSFQQKIDTVLGPMDAIFIRAPKIKSVGKNIRILAKNQREIIACEQKTKNNFYLAVCFHPELTTTKFHEYFLKQIVS